MSKRRLNWFAPVVGMILAGPAAAQTQTLTGKLIDLACYWQDTKNTGNVHNGRQLDCARACAREQFQVGVLTPDGKVYLLAGEVTAGKNRKLVPHMGEVVTVTGDLSEKDGMTSITASEIKHEGKGAKE
jgi:hypothetical protein